MTSATKAYIAAVQSASAQQTAPVPAQPADVPFVSYVGSGANMASNLIVPPGGFPGFAQQTPATQQMFARAGRIGGRKSAAKRRRRKSAKKKAAAPARRRRRSGGKLRKGSAAAKRRMAQLRRMRRRR